MTIVSYVLEEILFTFTALSSIHTVLGFHLLHLAALAALAALTGLAAFAAGALAAVTGGGCRVRDVTAVGGIFYQQIELRTVVLRAQDIWNPLSPTLVHIISRAQCHSSFTKSRTLYKVKCVFI